MLSKQQIDHLISLVGVYEDSIREDEMAGSQAPEVAKEMNDYYDASKKELIEAIKKLGQTDMNAQQLTKLLIIERAFALHERFTEEAIAALALTDLEQFDGVKDRATILSLITADNIDEVFEALEDCDDICDARNETRDSPDAVDVDNLSPKSYSRHYEIDVKAMKIHGQWVAWDYFYGGGKHGEPEAIDWIATARLVSCDEKEVMIVRRTFDEIKEEAQA